MEDQEDFKDLFMRIADEERSKIEEALRVEDEEADRLSHDQYMEEYLSLDY